MDKRLETIYSFIEDGLGVIDVGTDHGYLPAALAQRGYKGNIYASDIKRGPLDAAIRTADKADVAERIGFLLSDGLDACPPEAVDTIVVAGMGGDMICRILDRAEWCMDNRYKLLLQPMTKAEVLRYWLVNNEFEIYREELVEDGGAIYQVLVARLGTPAKLCDAELYTGSFPLIQQSPLFTQHIEKQIARFEKACAGLQESRSSEKQAREEVYRSVLQQLREEKDAYSKRNI